MKLIKFQKKLYLYIQSLEISPVELHKLANMYGNADTHMIAEIEILLTSINKDTNLDRSIFIPEGPSLEADEKYPLLDDHLKVAGENIYFAVLFH